MASVPRVAIACQGGGSHAAFAAGVLLGLLRSPTRDRFELVALSGTSGGAMCAALTWAGFASEGADDAIRRLSAFWHDLEARDPVDAVTNFWGLLFARMPMVPEVSPYSYLPAGEETLRRLLKKHLRLEELSGDRRRAAPDLYVGATDVLSGERVVFRGETLKYDDLVASAAVPPLFRSIAADGRLYWDGLFTTNPPVREFTDLPQCPDEIWVVQINPQRRESEPRTTRDIIDRRNELSGNLSLGQELAFIEKINELLTRHKSLSKEYAAVRIRVVELGIPNLDYPSKLDRSTEIIRSFIRHGEERSSWFFDERSVWPRSGAVSCASVCPTGPESTG